MNILVCHNYYQQRGGEDVVFEQESALLERYGHQVVRYSRHNDELASLKPWKVARETLWSRQTCRDVHRIARDCRPDLIHCHNTFPLISPSIYDVARELGIPVVQTLHNYRTICPGSTLMRNGSACRSCVGKTLPWQAVLHRCYRSSLSASAVVALANAWHHQQGTWRHRVNRFIAVSAAAREHFRGGGIPLEKIVVKSNFVDPDPSPSDGQSEDFVFVGRLSPEKGVATLVRAWDRLSSPPPLKILGDGPLRPPAVGQHPSIEWLGYQPQETVLRIVGECRGLIAPSTWNEPFGRMVIEAFAKGTPVIASRIGALADLVDDGRTGFLFRAGDADALAAAVDRMRNQAHQERSRMREHARKEYEQHFTAEANYRQLIGIYEDVLSAPVVSRPSPPPFEERPDHVDQHAVTESIA